MKGENRKFFRVRTSKFIRYQGLWEELLNDVFKNHIPSAVRFSLDMIPGQNVKENSRCNSKFLFFFPFYSQENNLVDFYWPW